MHAGAIPIAFDGFWVEFHCHTVLLGHAMKEVTGYPKVIGSSLALAENLKLPLPK